MDKNTTEKILEELEKAYPDAAPALHFKTPYELLVAVMLSAQCTDERVNKVTAELFKQYNTPQKMLTLSQRELEKYIYSCGFYHNKAAHILSASRDIMDKFGGEGGDHICIAQLRTAPFAVPGKDGGGGNARARPR